MSGNDGQSAIALALQPGDYIVINRIVPSRPTYVTPEDPGQYHGIRNVVPLVVGYPGSPLQVVAVHLPFCIVTYITVQGFPEGLFNLDTRYVKLQRVPRKYVEDMVKAAHWISEAHSRSTADKAQNALPFPFPRKRTYPLTPINPVPGFYDPAAHIGPPSRGEQPPDENPPPAPSPVPAS